jgi:hypothetical protein
LDWLAGSDLAIDALHVRSTKEREHEQEHNVFCLSSPRCGVSNQISRTTLLTLIIGKGRLQGKGNQVCEQP